VSDGPPQDLGEPLNGVVTTELFDLNHDEAIDFVPVARTHGSQPDCRFGYFDRFKYVQSSRSWAVHSNRSPNPIFVS